MGKSGTEVAWLVTPAFTLPMLTERIERYDIETLWEGETRSECSASECRSTGRLGDEYYNKLGYVP